MKIELSDGNKEYIEAKVSDGTYQSASEFVERLIDAHRRHEANSNTDETRSEDDQIQDFLGHLHKIGLLREPRPLSQASGNDDRQPVPIVGKPLSETIIEERR